MEVLNAVLFYTLAGLTALSAVAVVCTPNIVRAATWLLFTLAGTAGLFFLLGADFLGATQLLVYVGGTLVLLLFGVMLTAQLPSPPLRIRTTEWGLSLLVGLALYAALSFTLVAMPAPVPGGGADRPLPPSRVLGMALLGDARANPAGPLTGLPPGAMPVDRTRVGYLLPFEIVSVHLLVVLVGAAYLARARRKEEPAVAPSPAPPSPGEE